MYGTVAKRVYGGGVFLENLDSVLSKGVVDFTADFKVNTGD